MYCQKHMQLLSAEKAINNLFWNEDFFKTYRKVFFTFVSCSAATNFFSEEGNNLSRPWLLSRKQWSCFRSFKSMLQWNCLNFGNISPFSDDSNNVETSKLYVDTCFISWQVQILQNLAIYDKRYHFILKISVWKFSVLFFIHFRSKWEVSLCQLQTGGNAKAYPTYCPVRPGKNPWLFFNC